MEKAPNFSIVHRAQRPVEIGESSTPSSATYAESEEFATVSTASSTTPRTTAGTFKTRRPRKLRTTQSDPEQIPTPSTAPSPNGIGVSRLRSENSGTRRSYRKRYTADSDDNISDALDFHRIVIAIDYGTTFTGVAYATPSNEGDQNDTSTVQLVTDWGSRMTSERKIPSVISYSDPTHGERQFGADLSREAIAMINTKLELDAQESRLEELDLIIHMLDGMDCLNFDYIKESKGKPEYTWKTPEDIIQDYLAKAFDPFWKALEYTAEVGKTAPVDIVITFPVQWSYRARNSTFKAIRKAGFNQSRFPRLSKYVAISEPEAAAVYTARYIQEQGTVALKPNKCFILCDAGGGTVDVVGYRVTQVTPALQLERLTDPTGAKCGSSFINILFKKWLRRKLKEEYKKLDPRDEFDKTNASATETGPMRELMKAFEKIKKEFSRDIDSMRIDLPEPLSELTIPKLVNLGEMTITKSQMQSFFDPHVDEIIELIQGHIVQIEDQGRRPAALLLIGGFSESPYLQEELNESFVDIRGMQLHRPDTSWSAVVQGAALYGTELKKRENIQVMIPCPRHYGIKMCASYSKKSHDLRDTYTDSVTGDLMASQQLDWLIRKGDLLSEGEERTIEHHLTGNFREGSTRTFDVPVFANSDDVAPVRYFIAQEDVTQVRILSADFSQYPLEKFDKRYNIQHRFTYYEAYLVCKLTVKGMSILGELWWYDQCLDKFSIDNIDEVTEE